MQSQHSPIFSLKQTPERSGSNETYRVKQMAAVTHQTALKGAPATGLASLIEAAKTRYARYRIYRLTVNELSDLSNRELADLGLHRSMIRRLALQAAEEYVAR
ncbi:hypothetical protein NBRC116589_37370 [Ruegeria sp. HU-ET01832]